MAYLRLVLTSTAFLAVKLYVAGLKGSHYRIPLLICIGHTGKEGLRYLSACQSRGRSISSPTGTFLRHILLRIPLGYFLPCQKIQPRTSRRRYSHLILNIKLFFLITLVCYLLNLQQSFILCL
jgi:hypothetical protein